MSLNLKTYYPFHATHPHAQIAFSFHPIWYEWLEEKKVFQNKKFLKNLNDLLNEDKARRQLPDKELWFAAFQEDPRKIKVVILGQDPYPTREVINGRVLHMATGYSFDVAPPFGPTGSLKTIFGAIKNSSPTLELILLRVIWLTGRTKAFFCSTNFFRWAKRKGVKLR